MTAHGAPARHPGPGCVVEFMHGNRPQLAWVLEEQGGRLRVLTRNRRESKLPAARVLPWIGPCHGAEASRQEILEALEEHQERRATLEAQVDALELWSLAQGEVDKAGPRWFAELLWDEVDADRLAALGRALLECKTHFKFQPRSSRSIPRTRWRPARRRSGAPGSASAWWPRACSSSASSGTPASRAASGRGTCASPNWPTACGTCSSAAWPIPRTPRPGRCGTRCARACPRSRTCPCWLARAWGLVGPHHNYLLDQAGYDPSNQWAEAFSGEIEAVRERALARREPPEDPPFVSIDSATTRDLDDAFYLDDDPDHPGGLRLQVALACPVLGGGFGSDLDRAVAGRATSLYLPEGDSHMLPESLGTDFFSLLAGQDRPSLVVDFRLDARGAVRSCAPRLAWVRLAANLAYGRVEQCLEGGACPEVPEDPDLPARLGRALALCEALRERRLERGALVIEREEPELVLRPRPEDPDQGPLVALEAKEQAPKSQLLVSEMMILANSGMADWAREQGLPLLHRTQDLTLPRESAGVWSAPEDIHRVVKTLGSAAMDTAPKPHASLGVPAYAPVSSPLRRYNDFVNVAQVASWLETGQPCWTREELESRLPLLNARQEAVGQVQRFRPRYWKLLHIKQQGESARWSGVVVDENPSLVTVALPGEQLFVRGPRRLFGDKIYPGQRFSLRLGKIDPLRNTIYVLEAWEEE
jgi:exoribonuclease-2